MPTAQKSPQNPPVIYYSPSAARSFRFCQKKYYFEWLVSRKHGWQQTADHPWRKVYDLKQVKHHQMWSGDLYHQVIGHGLDKLSKIGHIDEQALRRLGQELAELQYNYSDTRQFIGAVKSRAPMHEDISTFLVLFEHVYDMPSDNLLENAQQELDQLLVATFDWQGWTQIIKDVRKNGGVYIERKNLQYMVAGARILARMDLGIDLPRRHFAIYDWKCYQQNQVFDDYNLKSFRHQLLTYALWAVRRSRNPIPLEQIRAYVFNPKTGKDAELQFTQGEVDDFELAVGRWVRLQSRLFKDVSDVDFEELSGPYEPARSCPSCQFKAVCSKEIVWHELK